MNCTSVETVSVRLVLAGSGTVVSESRTPVLRWLRSASCLAIMSACWSVTAPRGAPASLLMFCTTYTPMPARMSRMNIATISSINVNAGRRWGAGTAAHRSGGMAVVLRSGGSNTPERGRLARFGDVQAAGGTPALRSVATTASVPQAKLVADDIVARPKRAVGAGRGEYPLERAPTRPAEPQRLAPVIDDLVEPVAVAVGECGSELVGHGRHTLAVLLQRQQQQGGRFGGCVGGLAREDAGVQGLGRDPLHPRRHAIGHSKSGRRVQRFGVSRRELLSEPNLHEQRPGLGAVATRSAEDRHGNLFGVRRIGDGLHVLLQALANSEDVLLGVVAAARIDPLEVSRRRQRRQHSDDGDDHHDLDEGEAGTEGATGLAIVSASHHGVPRK